MSFIKTGSQARYETERFIIHESQEKGKSKSYSLYWRRPVQKGERTVSEGGFAQVGFPGMTFADLIELRVFLTEFTDHAWKPEE